VQSPFPAAPSSHEHVASFYAGDDTLVDRVAQFVREGLEAGEHVVCLLTAPHWRAVAERIDSASTDGDGLQSARVRVVDAEELVTRITVDGKADIDRFRHALMPLIEGHSRLRICGEVASLLARHDQLDKAIDIELIGQELAHSRQVRILCAYDMRAIREMSDGTVEIISSVHDRAEPSEPPVAADDDGSCDTPLVLLADDYRDAREMYGEYLEFAGFRVVLASDGEEAVRFARRHRPDVILMDVRMPGLTGTAAMRMLRKDDGFNHVPIIALTAHALDSERAAILADGFDGVISKPCLPDQLAQAIRMTLDVRATDPNES
jgi:two-component system cell cycle response regulator DivK